MKYRALINVFLFFVCGLGFGQLESIQLLPSRNAANRPVPVTITCHYATSASTRVGLPFMLRIKSNTTEPLKLTVPANQIAILLQAADDTMFNNLSGVSLDESRSDISPSERENLQAINTKKALKYELTSISLAHKTISEEKFLSSGSIDLEANTSLEISGVHKILKKAPFKAKNGKLRVNAAERLDMLNPGSYKVGFMCVVDASNGHLFFHSGMASIELTE
jgi:hypothetical protein